MANTLIPDYVDSRKIFAQQTLIEGVLPISRLERFSGAILDTEGDVQVSLQFDLDESFRKVIRGSLQADVNVACQRCLEPMPITLKDQFELAVVYKEEQALKLPKTLDPWFCEDIKLVLADMIEEQLILCMPIVSYHEQHCIAKLEFEAKQPNKVNGKQGEKVSENPFAILQKLKDK
ncbi:MAG: YceD family protein [Gammaproteobacteria bacterium]